jgi:hypothetical protein
MVQQEMSAIADDMPCCPDDRSVSPDCVKECPFALVCAAVLLSIPVAETDALYLLKLLGDSFRARSDAVVASVAGEPPPRPPRA